MGRNAVGLAVVGLSRWSKNIVRSFSRASGCRLAYICDGNPHLLEKHHRLYPQSTATDDYDAILRDSAVDAVAIAAPAPVRFDMARSALLAQKHVYVDKPLAASVERAEELIETAARGDRRLMVGYLLEHDPAVASIKEQIDRDQLGQIHYMYCQHLDLGSAGEGENAFWSLAPDEISIILHLFGAEPDRVAASGACFHQSGIEDVVFANLYFPDGRIAHIHVSRIDPHREHKIVVVGSQRMLVFDDVQPSEKLRIFQKGASPQLAADPSAQPAGSHHAQIPVPQIGSPSALDVQAQHFIDCILREATPPSDGSDALPVVRVLEKVQRQLCSTQTIQVSLAGARQRMKWAA